MICDTCGSKDALVRKVARTYGKGRKLLVIENVPVVTCSTCGESYLTADARHEIERIKLQCKRVAHQRPVAVASFG
jgi:YgiT-type zinc finger domain-containing protein